MSAFAIQTVILLVVAFLVGCLVGAWARRMCRRSDVPAEAEREPVKAVASAPAAQPAAPQEAAAEPSKKAAAPRKTAAKRRKTPAKQGKTAAAPRKRAAAGTRKDDLKLLSGVGPVLEKKLNSGGVKTFAQIAKWTKKDIAAFDEKLNFKGRIEREKWVQQAKVLASGRDTEFSKRAKKK